MDAIETLKAQAREKRDQAIADARAEFNSAMASIRKLERELAPKEKKPPRASGAPVFALVAASVPSEPFTCGDLLAALRKADPQREFTVGTVRVYLRMLSDRGMIQRVARGGRNQTVWESIDGATVPEKPFAALYIPDAAEVVLRERGPLRVNELVVALQDRGYRVDADPAVLSNSVSKSLNYHPERFYKVRGGRWSTSLKSDC